MVKATEEQERVSSLLTDTVALLCRNGLQFKNEMKVQGLLGITLDNEVFLVQIDKQFGDLVEAQVSGIHPNEEQSTVCSGEDATSDGRVSPRSKRKRKHGKSRELMHRTKQEPLPTKPSNIVVKTEPVIDDDDLILMDPDSKEGLHDKDSMRESYGIPESGPPMKTSRLDSSNTSPFITGMIQNTNSQSGDGNVVLPDQHQQPPGCSSWDDPLAALVATDQSTAVGPPGENSSGGDDSMDQQTMSTFLGYQDASSRAGMQMSSLGSSFGQTSPQFSQEMGDGKLHKCLHCRRSYYDKRHLVRHMYVAHGTLIDIKDPRLAKFYPCDFEGCSKQYCRRDHLKRHQMHEHGSHTQTTKRQYFCDIDLCGEKFDNLQDLLSHKNQIHGVPRPVYIKPPSL